MSVLNFSKLALFVFSCCSCRSRCDRCFACASRSSQCHFSLPRFACCSFCTHRSFSNFNFVSSLLEMRPLTVTGVPIGLNRFQIAETLHDQTVLRSQLFVRFRQTIHLIPQPHVRVFGSLSPVSSLGQLFLQVRLRVPLLLHFTTTVARALCSRPPGSSRA